MNSILISRLVGALIFGIGGGFAGLPIHKFIRTIWLTYPFQPIVTIVVCILFFAFFGFLIAPSISIKPFNLLVRQFKKESPQTLLAGIIGLVVGLIVAALFAYPLSLLPDVFGRVLPFVGVLLFGYLGVLLFTTRHEDFANFFRSISSKRKPNKLGNLLENDRKILVDTSVVIDGRIADIAATGFLQGKLIVPRFVLNELQYVSDSADSLRRQRGRRGIEVLSELQQNVDIPVTIVDVEVNDAKEVDDKLISLAKQMDCPILTNDYNLNRIAEIQGIKVLNINDLANAVKVILLPGETFPIRVIQEGKEFNQGVGYLDDGTMVVIENGSKLLDKEVEVTVTKILQTSAGRMIFAKPE
ncbi:MAG: TRAM domain-containing protein [Anaerolineaceae bacterium]|nr:TRAM domain-containing protein [Anaerolineaceae bacterium]